MKKSITAMALLASATSAHALVGPGTGPVPTPNVACVAVSYDADGSLHAADCDETRNNKRLGRKLLANGCAEDQARIVSYDIEIPACMHIAQL